MAVGWDRIFGALEYIGILGGFGLRWEIYGTL